MLSVACAFRCPASAPDRDVDQPVEPECQARAGGLDRVANIQILDVREPRSVVAPARERQREPAVLEWLVIGEVDPPVLGELRVQHHVEHAGGATGAHGRQTGNRRGIEPALADGEHLAGGPDTDKKITVGERQQAPRPLDAARDDRHANFLLERLVDVRLRWQRKPRAARRRGPGLCEQNHACQDRGAKNRATDNYRPDHGAPIKRDLSTPGFGVNFCVRPY